MASDFREPTCERGGKALVQSHDLLARHHPRGIAYFVPHAVEEDFEQLDLLFRGGITPWQTRHS